MTARLPESLMPALSDVLESSMTDSATAIDSESAIEEKEGDRLFHRSRSLPSVRSFARYRQEDSLDTSVIELDERLYYEFVGRYPIYHWGALASDRKIGDLAVEMQRLSSVSSFGRLALRIRSSYLELMIAKQEAALSQSRMEMNQRELDQLIELRDAGSVSPSRVDYQSTIMERVILDRDRVSMRFENLLYDLALLSGVDAEAIRAGLPEKVPEFKPIDPEVIAQVRAASANMLMENESVLRADKQVDLEARRLQIVRQQLKPKIDFEVGLTQNERENDGRVTEEELAFAGIHVRWNIFDGFSTKGRKQSALQRMERADRQAKTALRELSVRCDRLLQNLEMLSRSLKVEERLLGFQVHGYKIATDNYESKKISFKEFSEIEQRLSAQSLTAQRSRNQYLNTVAELVSLLGFDPFVAKYARSLEID